MLAELGDVFTGHVKENTESIRQMTEPDPGLQNGYIVCVIVYNAIEPSRVIT